MNPRTTPPRAHAREPDRNRIRRGAPSLTGATPVDPHSTTVAPHTPVPTPAHPIPRAIRERRSPR